MSSPTAERLTILASLKLSSVPIFLRRISRPKIWNEALLTNNPTAALEYLLDPHGVSLWQVANDLDLRRVAIAINESRDSFTEKLEFLPILPDELKKAGVPYEQTRGETECAAAAGLHYDAWLDDQTRERIVRLLIEAKRELGRCTRGQMAKALEESQQDGCFAVVADSTSCKCGERGETLQISA